MAVFGCDSYHESYQLARPRSRIATLIWAGMSTLSALCLERPSPGRPDQTPGEAVAHRTSMMRLPWIVLSLVSNTVMMASEFVWYRNRPLKVCTPLSAAVMVYAAGSLARVA